MKRFVGAGTCFEYAWLDHGACDETATPLVPRTLYGTAKDATRRVLETYLASSGVSFAWARLFFLYGEGEGFKRLVPSIADSLRAGREAHCSPGLVVRDFIDVRDAGRALAAIAASQATGAINVAGSVAHSIADVAKLLGELSRRPELIRLGALPDRPDDPPRIVADISRLRHEIGFKFIRDLREGLRDALRD